MDIFSAPYSNQYDHIYSEKNYKSECDLVEMAIKRFTTNNPHSILDLGCGTGGHAIEFLKRGYDVTGVDLSPSMLEIAKKKYLYLQCPSKFELINADVRNFKSAIKYDIAIMFFAVIGYLTTNEDVLMGLKNIREKLTEDSLFICDFWYGPSVLSIKPSDRVRMIDLQNGKMLRTSSTNLNTADHTAEVNFKSLTIENGLLISDVEERHLLRYFFPKEFELMLNISGFELLNMSSFPSLTESLTDRAWNALVVARAK
jgi:SAM-dependent methyltransferase